MLLLGSYDKKTKLIMDTVKQEIERMYSGEIFTAVLSSLEIYDTDKFQVLAEEFDNNRLSLYLIDNYGYFQEAYDLSLPATEDKTEFIKAFLARKYGVAAVIRQTTAVKLDSLMRAAQVILLIREKEETRGGEYIELMYALNKGYANKIWFFKKDGIKLSSMLMEYMDMYEVLMRFYSDVSDLERGVMRIIDYCIQDQE